MRKQILSLLFLFPAVAMAEQQWTIVTQDGAAFALDSVTCLLASDTEDAFTIVLGNGSLQPGVTEATFKKQDLASIASPSLSADTPSLAIEARSRLTLTGCAEGTPIRVYSADGKLQRSATATGQTATLDVAALPGGVYVVRIGEVSIKFSKK